MVASRLEPILTAYCEYLDTICVFVEMIEVSKSSRAEKKTNKGQKLRWKGKVAEMNGVCSEEPLAMLVGALMRGRTATSGLS